VLQKSCLIKRYCEKKFVPKYISTIGVDFGVRQVRTEEGVETKVNFCQTRGTATAAQVCWNRVSD
jgi:DnaJ family protein C protein 27